MEQITQRAEISDVTAKLNRVNIFLNRQINITGVSHSMKKQWKVLDHFDNLAKQYNNYRMLDKAPVNFLVKTVSGKQQTICDLGCGTGRYLIALIKKFHASGVVIKGAHGVDISPAMLEIARLETDGFKPSLNWHLAPSDRTGLPARSISLVTAFNSIHHLPICETLAEVERILLPDGFFAIYTRTRDQEEEHLWGRWFPRYLEFSQIRTHEVMSSLSKHNKHFRLVRTQYFTFTRKASFAWICKQTRNRYYSTLDQYPQREFMSAYSIFVENIRKNYKDLRNITYPSSYTFFIYQLVI